MGENDAFDAWIDTLNEDVIQQEYGYEEGEFNVCPGMWRPLFDEGLTPSQAFRRALDAYRPSRRPASPEGTRAEVLEEPEAMKLLRGPLSRRATSAEFNEWQARDIVEYVDRLRTLGEKP